MNNNTFIHRTARAALLLFTMLTASTVWGQEMADDRLRDGVNGTIGNLTSSCNGSNTWYLYP